MAASGPPCSARCDLLVHASSPDFPTCCLRYLSGMYRAVSDFPARPMGTFFSTVSHPVVARPTVIFLLRLFLQNSSPCAGFELLRMPFDRSSLSPTIFLRFFLFSIFFASRPWRFSLPLYKTVLVVPSPCFFFLLVFFFLGVVLFVSRQIGVGLTRNSGHFAPPFPPYFSTVHPRCSKVYLVGLFFFQFHCGAYLQQPYDCLIPISALFCLEFSFGYRRRRCLFIPSSALFLLSSKEIPPSAPLAFGYTSDYSMKYFSPSVCFTAGAKVLDNQRFLCR